MFGGWSKGARRGEEGAEFFSRRDIKPEGGILGAYLELIFGKR